MSRSHGLMTAFNQYSSGLSPTTDGNWFATDCEVARRGERGSPRRRSQQPLLAAARGWHWTIENRQCVSLLPLLCETS